MHLIDVTCDVTLQSLRFTGSLAEPHLPASLSSPTLEPLNQDQLHFDSFASASAIVPTSPSLLANIADPRPGDDEALINREEVSTVVQQFQANQPASPVRQARSTAAFTFVPPLENTSLTPIKTPDASRCKLCSLRLAESSHPVIAVFMLGRLQSTTLRVLFLSTCRASKDGLSVWAPK